MSRYIVGINFGGGIDPLEAFSVDDDLTEVSISNGSHTTFGNDVNVTVPVREFLSSGVFYIYDTEEGEEVYIKGC